MLEWHNRVKCPKTLDALMDMCDLIPEAGCWIWRHSLMSGYGCVGKKQMHRLSFALSHGHEAKGLVCHTCDVRCCVNPNHLYDGTKSSNQKDAIARGRAKKPPRRPERISPEQLINVAQLMRDGASMRSAAQSIGTVYQALQVPYRRRLLNQYLGK